MFDITEMVAMRKCARSLTWGECVNEILVTI